MTSVMDDASPTRPPPGGNPDEYLTRAEAAAEVRVTQATITNWVRTGRLRADRTPTGAYRIRRRWLSEAMDP
jgi:excisionase family DNA binding protein